MDPTIIAALISGASSLGKAGIDHFSSSGTQDYEMAPAKSRGQLDVLKNMINQLKRMGGRGGSQRQSIDWLADLLDPESEAYDSLEAPYLREFNEKTVPGLAERFAGLGGRMGGGLSSSAFGQSLSSAGAGLQENLAKQRTEYQRGASQDILSHYLGLSGLGLGTDPFAYLAYS